MAELVELGPRVQEIGSSVPGQINPMTYKIDTCHFLVWCSALIGLAKDWFAQCQENMMECGNLSWCQRPDFPVRQHYKVDEYSVISRKPS